MPTAVITTEEQSLLERAQSGEVAAFEELVARHRDRVFGLALRMTRSEADAAEIAQETFLSAYQHLSEFRGEAAFGTWVHKIAANRSLMQLRHQKVVRATVGEAQEGDGQGDESLGAPSGDWGRRADEQILDAELSRAIEQATDRLPAPYREVFLLKDVEELSYEEIAELLHDSVPAIKSRLHRARLSLRQTIQQFYEEKKR